MLYLLRTPRLQISFRWMLTLLLTMFALGPSGSPGASYFTECEEKRSNKAHYLKCTERQAAGWESIMDVELRTVLIKGRLSPRQIRRSQRAWLDYRSANCRAYEGQFADGAIRAAKCRWDMTGVRALELREMLQEN